MYKGGSYLPMINVPNSPDINVRLVPLEHGSITPTRPQKMRLFSPRAEGALNGIACVGLGAQSTGCAEEGACERHRGCGDGVSSIRERGDEGDEIEVEVKARVDATGLIWAGLRVVRSGIL